MSRSPSESHRVYERELASHGYVAIDVEPERSLLGRRRYRGSVVVERRAEPRRAGHAPPVIAEARGRSMEEVVRQLLPAAQYDPAIAAALLRREHAAA